MARIAFIRPPANSRYNDADVREESLITYALGYLSLYNKISDEKLTWKVFDYVLDYTLDQSSLEQEDFDVYVIAIRETSSAPHYALRIAHLLKNKRVIIYGQVARFAKHPKKSTFNAEFVIHSEALLLKKVTQNEAAAISFDFTSSQFLAKPYYQSIQLSPERHKRFRASLETTRGCHFKCKFCFINHGENHFESWQTRATTAILKDIERYYNDGIRFINFMDSEFFGIDKTYYAQIEKFLLEVVNRFPDLKFMIYARADTLIRFGQFEMLRQAGLSSVFIGAESFSDEELSALNKGIKAKQLLYCIQSLLDNNISMYLSFIIFNRATTKLSLRKNISRLKELYSHRNKSLLGMPNFIFNFESSWSGEGAFKLSDYTYIKWAQYYKQPLSTDLVVYDTNLEPLMELYRALHYEITKKSRDLNYLIDTNDGYKLESWHASISSFSLHLMELFLDKFERSELSIESIKENLIYMFSLLEYFYSKTLPDSLQNLLTSDETLNQMYATRDRMPYLDHGWDHIFPPADLGKDNDYKTNLRCE